MNKAEEDTLLRVVLSADPIAEAERIYGENPDNFMFPALRAMHAQTDMAKNMLIKRRDVYHHMMMDDYLEVMGEEGFELIHSFNYKSKYSSADHDTMRYLWHPEGILLAVSSYNGKSVNGGHLYYNWCRTDFRGEAYPFMGSGSYSVVYEDEHKKPVKALWVGNYDCREAVRFHLEMLRAQGELVNPWKQIDHIWLLNSADEMKIEDECNKVWNCQSPRFDAINRQRFEILTQKVKEKTGRAIWEPDLDYLADMCELMAKEATGRMSDYESTERLRTILKEVAHNLRRGDRENPFKTLTFLADEYAKDFPERSRARWTVNNLVRYGGNMLLAKLG